MTEVSRAVAGVSKRTHNVEVAPGVSLRVVEKWAVNHGPAVLFVHGLGVGGGYWDLPIAGYSTMDHMATRGLRAYALDYRGYGPSTTVSGCAVRAEVATQDVAGVIDFIRRHSGAQRICLVGHSWGAMVASMTAAAHPDIVESLVLIGMPYRRLHREFQERIGAFRCGCSPVDGWMPNPTHLSLQDRLYAHDREVLHAYVEMVNADYPLIPTGILDDCQELPHRESLSRLRCPVLVISGTLETVVDATDMLDLVNDLQAVHKELILVGNVGHLAGLERLAHGRIDEMLADWALEHAHLEGASGD